MEDVYSLCLCCGCDKDNDEGMVSVSLVRHTPLASGNL